MGRAILEVVGLNLFAIGLVNEIQHPEELWYVCVGFGIGLFWASVSGRLDRIERAATLPRDANGSVVVRLVRDAEGGAGR
jgi:hypothetical protein